MARFCCRSQDYFIKSIVQKANSIVFKFIISSIEYQIIPMQWWAYKKVDIRAQYIAWSLPCRLTL